MEGRKHGGSLRNSGGEQSGSGCIPNIMAVNLAASRCTLPHPCLSPLLSSPPPVQPMSFGSDKTGSRRTSSVWLQSLQVCTQLLNCHFSPAASGAFTLHTSANSTPGVERHGCSRTWRVSLSGQHHQSSVKGLQTASAKQVCGKRLVLL